MLTKTEIHLFGVTFSSTFTVYISSKGSLKKKIAYFETLSQLTLPAPPLSPIETILIETFLFFVDPSPPYLQLRHIIFPIRTNISQFLKINLI